MEFDLFEKMGPCLWSYFYYSDMNCKTFILLILVEYNPGCPTWQLGEFLILDFEKELHFVRILRLG